MTRATRENSKPPRAKPAYGASGAGVEDEARSDPPFAKTKTAKGRPPLRKKQIQNHFGVLRVLHPPSVARFPKSHSEVKARPPALIKAAV
jgi:hypothetical protein